ncbi:response regulator [Sphingomonas daechungensis]|uniref:Response regulator n=1 Tax=Sphingomonas daechungensis TaxID=1176646 RepID=A0ABX6T535_9SPHN|nr:response regulator [Sphingomonas daechungensis]QNP44037.1 response regulator [Sphingomonas daechungensis]
MRSCPQFPNDVRGATILILEDEPIIGLALEDMLVRSGASVLHASRIEEARDLVELKHIDAAILDVNVHGAMSYPIADMLAERAIPFIFATGYGDRSHPPSSARCRPWRSHTARMTSKARSGPIEINPDFAP